MMRIVLSEAYYNYLVLVLSAFGPLKDIDFLFFFKVYSVAQLVSSFTFGKYPPQEGYWHCLLQF